MTTSLSWLLNLFFFSKGENKHLLPAIGIIEMEKLVSTILDKDLVSMTDIPIIIALKII